MENKYTILLRKRVQTAALAVVVGRVRATDDEQQRPMTPDKIIQEEYFALAGLTYYLTAVSGIDW